MELVVAEWKKLLTVSWTPRAPLAGHSWIMFDFGSSSSVSLLLRVYIRICCKSTITSHHICHIHNLRSMIISQLESLFVLIPNSQIVFGTHPLQ